MDENGDTTVPLSEYDGHDWDDVEEAPPPDSLFGILSDVHRRRVLWFLLERSDTTVEELADVLAGWRAADEAFVDADDRRELLVSLHHVHLPRLADAGLVTYDADAGSVRLSSLPDPVESVIEFGYRYEQAVGSAET